MKSLSRVQLFVNSWTVARQAPLSMGFSRQEYWTGLPFSSPGDLPDPGIKPRSPTLQANSLPFELPGNPNRGLDIEKEIEKDRDDSDRGRDREMSFCPANGAVNAVYGVSPANILGHLG